MVHPDSFSAAQFWRRRAAILANKVNFHHWLSRAIPLLVGLFVLAALLEIFVRETGQSSRWIGIFLLMGSFGITGWAWLQSRKHFCTERNALVRIETVLNLHNQLSSAEDGVLPWPAPREKFDDGYSANWRQILTPFLGGLLFLWVAQLVPVSRVKAGTANDVISPPPEFAQMQTWINTLKAEDLVEADKLQEMQSALDKLKNRPQQDWYTQSDLEAASSLKELAEQSMNSLAQDLDQADQAVQAMKERAESSSAPGNLEAMQDQLRKAGENLASGNLPLKKELVDQLRGAEAATDKQLSAKQLQELHERLEKGKMAAQTARKGNGNLSQEMQEAMAKAEMRHGQGRRKLMMAPGGTGGGKESAPLELQGREAMTSAGALTPVSNSDMSHASIGETVKVSASTHTVDPAAYRGSQNAGTAPVGGNGGEAVWRSTYDPQEADTLTQFFK